MNRFQVIVNKEPTDNGLIRNPDNYIGEIVEYYKTKLEEASIEKKESLQFENIPFAEKTSDNFQNICRIEKCIMDFMREHEYPKLIQVVCSRKEIAELYKVVYNFYYAGNKAERLPDDKWD